MITLFDSPMYLILEWELDTNQFKYSLENLKIFEKLNYFITLQFYF